MFNISSKYFLANILKLLANRVFVLIANVVKEGEVEIKTARQSDGAPDSEKQKIRFFSFFVNFFTKKDRCR